MKEQIKIRKKLLEGNKRFFSGKMTHKRQDLKRRKELTKGQKPFAVVLCCSDSRVSPEIIFDQGLGDLFVVRVAGNIVCDEVIGSIEYAVEHLNVSYVMVLGHERCGAICACIETKGKKVHGKVASLINSLAPSIKKGLSMKGDPVENACFLNVEAMAKKIIKSSRVVKEKVSKGELLIDKAYYCLESGKAKII